VNSSFTQQTSKASRLESTRNLSAIFLRSAQFLSHMQVVEGALKILS
jgi:hypothetical protein